MSSIIKTKVLDHEVHVYFCDWQRCWVAYSANLEPDYSPRGEGQSQEDAVADLKWQLEEREEKHLSAAGKAMLETRGVTTDYENGKWHAYHDDAPDDVSGQGDTLDDALLDLSNKLGDLREAGRLISEGGKDEP